VCLVEADELTGGCLRWITRLPGMGEWGRLVAHRTVQLRRLANLKLETGRRLDAAGIRDAGADLVVLATGSAWAADGLNPATRGPIPGADASLAHVLTPEQVVLDGKRPPGSRVVVYDCDGYFTGPAVAELLAREGLSVQLVTPHHQVASFAEETLEDAHTRARLHELGVAMRRATTVVGLERGGVRAQDEFADALEIQADGVVLVTQRVSDDRLWRELEGLPGLHRIGDCVAPRLIADAVFDGHRLARELESDDPGQALPYLRERPGMPLAEPAPAESAPPAAAGRPRVRAVELLDGSVSEMAGRIAGLVAAARPDVVVTAGRGAGVDLGPYRDLAARLGARFAVTRPQVEAGRAGRRELVGASSETVAPALYLGLGVSGALPHVAGMQGSRLVIAVNTDPGAPIFEHADYGAVADAGELVSVLAGLLR
jgi:electron transfer flavoprotein alpha subunit